MSADNESSGVNARQQAFSTDSTGVPDKQGYMVKQGQLVKNWKKRWFVLDKGVLQYFELPDDTVPKGQMSLFGAKVRFLPDAVREHCIEVSTTNRYLRCATDDDKEIQAWKVAIESAVDKIVADSEAPKWKDGDKCEICSNEFSFTNRKHHCRACGGLFCSTCADKALPLPQFGMHVPVRVCNNCYMASRRRSLSTINLANVSDETIQAAAPVEDEDSSFEVEDEKQKEDEDVADDAAADEPAAVDQAAPADDDEDKTKEEEEAAKAKEEEEAAAKAKEEAEQKAQEEARKAKEEEERLAAEAARKAKLEEEARLAAKAAKEQEEARRKEEEARKVAERQAAEKAAAEAARKKAEEEASLKAQQEEEERKKREAAERQKAREEKEAIAAAAIANGVTEQPAKPAAAAKADDTAAKKPVQRTFTLKDRVKRLRAGVTMWKLPHWGKAKQTKVHLVKSGKEWGVSWESKKSNHTMMLKECELLQGQQTDMFKKDKFSQFAKQAELSFSLKSSKRTLDLVCLNADDYNTWISTIQEIIFS